MSGRRLAWTTAGMAAVAVLLAAVVPDLSGLGSAVTHPQRLADTAGPDTLVLLFAGALAWMVWAWGALGLLLTAGSALPGVAGRLARLLASAVLPAGARRAAALALGLSLGMGAPLIVGSAAMPTTAMPTTAVPTTAAVQTASTIPTTATLAGPTLAGPATAGVPDWPTAAGVPDWPGHPTEHVVLRGDCLWDVAAAWLSTASRTDAPTAAEIAVATHAWWQANADVIGADPDLIRPGQVLRAPP